MVSRFERQKRKAAKASKKVAVTKTRPRRPVERGVRSFWSVERLVIPSTRKSNLARFVKVPAASPSLENIANETRGYAGHCRQIDPRRPIGFVLRTNPYKVQGRPWRGSRGAEPRVGLGDAQLRADGN